MGQNAFHNISLALQSVLNMNSQVKLWSTFCCLLARFTELGPESVVALNVIIRIMFCCASNNNSSNMVVCNKDVNN